MPADQVIKDKKKLINSILDSYSLVESGYINTFGITPTHPSTQFGYIKPKNKKLSKHSSEVESFLENLVKRKQINFFKSKSYFWNSGIFFFSAKSFLNEIKSHVPKTYKKVKEVFLEKKKFLNLSHFQKKNLNFFPINQLIKV